MKNWIDDSDNPMFADNLFEDDEDVRIMNAIMCNYLTHKVWNFLSFPEGSDNRKVRLEINNEHRSFDITVPDEAVYIGMEQLEPGDLVHVITKNNQSPITDAMLVCPEKLFTAFETIFGTPDAIHRLEALSMMSQAQRKYVIPVVLSGDVNRSKKLATDHLYDLDELKVKYDLIRHTLSNTQRSRIDELFLKVECFRDIELRRSSPLPYQQLKLILNINPFCPDYKATDYNTLMQKLDKAIYGFEKAKKHIAEAIIAAQFRNGNKGIKICLIGRPGVGKTVFAKTIAEVCHLPYCEISFSGLDDPMEITGDDPSYDKATEGNFVAQYFYCGTNQCVFLLDEIDKSGAKPGDSKPINTLLDALGDRAFFHCHFTEYDFDTGNTIFIATANSKEAIPDYLLNRFDCVISLEEYSRDDRLSIARNYIIPELKREWTIDMSNIDITDAALKRIESAYCSDDGMRMMKSYISGIFRHYAPYLKNSDGKTITVDEADVISLLGSPDIKHDPDVRYRNNMEKYSPLVRAELISIRNELCKEDMDASRKEILRRRYDILSKMVRSDVRILDLSACERVKTCLDKNHYKLDAVKKQVVVNVHDACLRKSSLSGIKLLLVGPPGVGKTSIAGSIAEALGEPLISVSLSSITHPASILGSSPSIKDAACGIIVNEINKADATHGILLLNELDKLCSYNDQNLSDTLVDLLDSNPSFTDEFLGVPIDMSGFMIIASANDVSHIAPWILDRFKVINIEGYSEKEKLTILSKYVLPKIIAIYSASGIKIRFSAEAQKYLIHEYCPSAGIRDVERSAEEIIRETLYNRHLHKSMTIGVVDVRNALGTPKGTREAYPQTQAPGTVRALAVSGSTGSTFAIETVILPCESKETIITGLAERVIEESVRIAKTYARVHYTEGRDFGMHLSFAEGAVKKDGPSAGIAILISILSALKGVTVPSDIAYTGEIDLHGNVYAVGGVKQKLIAAQRANCKSVYLPKSNFDQLGRDFLNELSEHSLSVKPVRHVSEVISDVLRDTASLSHRQSPVTDIRKER